jgi:hypothetical protein
MLTIASICRPITTGKAQARDVCGIFLVNIIRWARKSGALANFCATGIEIAITAISVRTQYGMSIAP